MSPRSDTTIVDIENRRETTKTQMQMLGTDEKGKVDANAVAAILDESNRVKAYLRQALIVAVALWICTFLIFLGLLVLADDITRTTDVGDTQQNVFIGDQKYLSDRDNVPIATTGLSVDLSDKVNSRSREDIFSLYQSSEAITLATKSGGEYTMKVLDKEYNHYESWVRLYGGNNKVVTVLSKYGIPPANGTSAPVSVEDPSGILQTDFSTLGAADRRVTHRSGYTYGAGIQGSYGGMMMSQYNAHAQRVGLSSAYAAKYFLLRLMAMPGGWLDGAVVTCDGAHAAFPSFGSLVAQAGRTDALRTMVACLNKPTWSQTDRSCKGVYGSKDLIAAIKKANSASGSASGVTAAHWDQKCANYLGCRTSDQWKDEWRGQFRCAAV